MERVLTQATTAIVRCVSLLPLARNGHSLVFDPAGKRGILFGGAAGIGAEFRDTWEIRIDSMRRCWFSELHPRRVAPPARWGHSAVLRDAAREMVVFGGCDNGRPQGDVWALRLSRGAEDWRACETSGIGPAPRGGAAAVYHPGHDSMIIFGGLGTEPFRDTWELKFATMEWRRLATNGPAPDASVECAAVYDAAGDRMLVVTGRDKDLFHSETWALDVSDDRASWDKLLTSGVPPEPRAGSALGSDERGRLLYVFGGWSYPPMVFHDDLRVLDVGSLAWRRHDLVGTKPVGRRLGAMALDPDSGNLLLFGGENQWRAYIGDAWCMAVQSEP